MREMILKIIILSMILTSCCSYKTSIKENKVVKISPTTKYFNKKMKQLKTQIAQN